MACFSLEGVIPVVHPSAYVHPSAVLIGDVHIGPNCYVGPLASLRGDFGRIVLHEGANIQDTCVMHGFPGSDTVVGRNGHIGHGAVLHGCDIGEDVLVGMNAVIMDQAEIGRFSFVAATSFVKARFVCPDRSLVVGSPASVKRALRQEEIEWKREGTREYQRLASRCLNQMVLCEPLCEPEEGRPSLMHHSEFNPKGSG